MKNKLRIIVFIMIAFSSWLVFADDDFCDCPVIKCDEKCQVEQEISFYSQKCKSGTKVKSCSRPVCIKKENSPSSCEVINKEAIQQKNLDSKISENNSSGNSSNNSEGINLIGTVKYMAGLVQLKTKAEVIKPVLLDDGIHEGDRILTGETGKVQIQFRSGNLLNVTPNTEVVITDASDSVPDVKQKKMLLDLIKGKVRSQVNQKYEGDQAYYRVRTSSAVAGVRGTEFVVTALENKNEFETKVETLEGRVALSDVHFSKIEYSVKNESLSYFSNGEGVKDQAAEGHFSQIKKLDEDLIDAIDRETLFVALNSKHTDGKAHVQKKSNFKNDEICKSPSADLNQCSWVCEKNPVNEKKCRTDLPQVSCVRRICNANGVWTNPVKLPVIFQEKCLPAGFIVKSCDY
jgi:hypothetical protein